MLKTVEYSRSKKTRGVAVTYRAGNKNKYGTCPTDCSMNNSGTGSKEIDAVYLDALLDAVPAQGKAWTYSHFDPHVFKWGKKLKEGKTVINFSTENPTTAAASIINGVPSVLVVNQDYWQGGKTQTAPWEVQVVRCPAEYKEGFSCADCGNGTPLCARLTRNYIIGFTAHGPSKRAAADPTLKGGCYADAGNCRIWWDQTANTVQNETDAEKLTRFAKSLPPYSMIRHHVAGDIGT